MSKTEKLKIYRVQYETYGGVIRGMVVVSKSPNDAKQMFKDTNDYKGDLICEFMGYPKPGRREGIIL